MAINHGTSGGYHAHRRLGQPACDSCREAINKYVREYRSSKGKDRLRSKDKLRRLAMAELREAHRTEYEEIFEALCEREEQGDL